MKNENILNILYQSDNNYASLTGISLTSLLMNNQNIKEINIYILNDHIDKENITKLRKLCNQYKRNLTLIDSASISKEVKSYDLPKFHGGYTAYFKLFVFNELKLQNDLLLYIDGDTIINGSLKDLLNIDMTGYVFGAVCDGILNKYKKAFLIPENKKYVNTGIFLLNRKEWQKQNCENKIKFQAQSIKLNYKYADQDLINTLFYDKIKKIDLRYNFNPGIFLYGIKDFLKLYNLKNNYYYSNKTIEDAQKNIVIYHCLAGMTGRPWEEDSIHPYNEIFFKYKKISLWKDIPLIKKKKPLYLKIQRFMYLHFPRKIYLFTHKKALSFEYNKLIKENKKYFDVKKEEVIK